MCKVKRSETTLPDGANLFTLFSASPYLAGPDDFPGFYAVFLPDRCWDNSGTRLLLNDQWGSFQEVLLVDTDTGKVTNVTGDKKGAWLILDVCGDIVAAQYASPNQCPALVSGCGYKCGQKRYIFRVAKIRLSQKVMS